jgi:hypothetical protein
MRSASSVTRCVDDGLRFQVAGVVDQDVEAAIERFLKLGSGAIDAGWLGDIELNPYDLGRVRTWMGGPGCREDVPLQGLEVGPGADGDGGSAGLGEGKRGGPADASGCAGNEDMPTPEWRPAGSGRWPGRCRDEWWG